MKRPGAVRRSRSTMIGQVDQAVLVHLDEAQTALGELVEHRLTREDFPVPRHQ